MRRPLLRAGGWGTGDAVWRSEPLLAVRLSAETRVRCARGGGADDDAPGVGVGDGDVVVVVGVAWSSPTACDCACCCCWMAATAPAGGVEPRALRLLERRVERRALHRLQRLHVVVLQVLEHLAHVRAADERLRLLLLEELLLHELLDDELARHARLRGRRPRARELLLVAPRALCRGRELLKLAERGLGRLGRLDRSTPASRPERSSGS